MSRRGLFLPDAVIFGFQVSEKCPSCGHPEAYSKELQVRVALYSWHETLPHPFLQMRSADEGSTILFTVGFFILLINNFSPVCASVGIVGMVGA